MNLIQQNLDRYLSDSEFQRCLGKHGICVIADFKHNLSGIEAFWQRYWQDDLPRVMLCGINPGRFGAGQTGIPFVDFQSLSRLIPDVTRQDAEKSATFFFKVAEAFGLEQFFRTFYISNVSSVGYLDSKGKNLNYHDLPREALDIVERNFNEEIEFVQPTHIISLSKEAHATIRRCLPEQIECRFRLPHPSWIMTYRQSEQTRWVDKYLEVLNYFRRDHTTIYQKP